jgi:hypothetical protein
MDAKVALYQKLKALASDLGRVPKRDEFVALYGETQYRKAFGSFTVFLQGAGLKEESKPEKKPKFKFKKSHLESFKINEIDLDSLFEQFGNPEILRITAQPDTHMKNRDHGAVNAYLEFVEWYQPHIAIIGGDLMDADGISHWPSGSLEPKAFIPEVVETRQFLDQLQSKVGPTGQILYIEGNHEDWIRQAMVAKMPEFFYGLAELGLMPDLKALLELDARGIQLFPVNEIVKIGKAHFTHGLYTGPSAPKKHLDTVKGNIYYFHTHDVLTHHQPSISGYIESASLGCLCRLDAPFLKGKPNNWVHAFGVFEFQRNGNYSFYCPKIFNGSFSFNGKRFGGK